MNTLLGLAMTGTRAGLAPAWPITGGVPREAPSGPIAEARFRALVEQIPAVTFMACLDGTLRDIYVSPQIEALLGYTQEEWLRDPTLWYRRLHPDDRGVWIQEFARGIGEGGPFRAECRFRARDGRVVWVRGEARIISGQEGSPLFLQGVAFDITDARLARERDQAALKEKEVLLREIHHRVKNNLQITSSLLSLQAERIGDPAVREAFRESQNRIRALAMVHERLYRSDSLACIALQEYLHGLVAAILRSYQRPTGAVTWTVETDGARVGIEEALPCGLIVIELVSNAAKHAFPDGTGEVHVRFGHDGPRKILSVEDDGQGIPESVDLAHPATLGLSLVHALASQLQGKAEILPGKGTRWQVSFPR